MPPNIAVARPRTAGVVTSRTLEERAIRNVASPTPTSAKPATKSTCPRGVPDLSVNSDWQLITGYGVARTIDRARQPSATTNEASPEMAWPVASVRRAPSTLRDEPLSQCCTKNRAG